MRIPLFCIMAERIKHIHAQRSFRFLVERHKTLADGMLAKRLVGETTGLLHKTGEIMANLMMDFARNICTC